MRVQRRGEGDLDDSISLTLPGDGRYSTVARIVVGGLAARHNLSYENLDDLQLAVESVLGEGVAAGDDVTMRLAVEDGTVIADIGPVDESAVETALGPPGELGLRIVLAAVVDSVSVRKQGDDHWVRLEKQVPFLPKD